MLDFQEELKTHTLTLQLIAEKAAVPFREVYKFHSGAFALVHEEDQIKIICALSALTNQHYTLSDFVHHPNILPPDIPVPRSLALPLGARGGTKSLPVIEELKRNERGLQVWAVTIQQSHRPKDTHY